MRGAAGLLAGCVRPNVRQGAGQLSWPRCTSRPAHHVRSHLPVSRTSAITSSTGPRPAAGASARRRFPRASAVTAVIVVATLVGLALRLYQLSRPGYLLGITEYDDGTDFGSAVRLINGALPYRDFIMVQPPGITLLMAPVALATKAAGTVAGMAAGRGPTALARAAATPLAGLLTPPRGRHTAGGPAHPASRAARGDRQLRDHRRVPGQHAGGQNRAAGAVAGAVLPAGGARGVRRRPAGRRAAPDLGRARVRVRRRGEGMGHPA